MRVLLAGLFGQGHKFSSHKFVKGNDTFTKFCLTNFDKQPFLVKNPKILLLYSCKVKLISPANWNQVMGITN